MTDPAMTADDLARILRESAGADGDSGLDAAGLDLTFEDLGYDSIALLETVNAIEREYGLACDDGLASKDSTPRELIDAINTQLHPDAA